MTVIVLCIPWQFLITYSTAQYSYIPPGAIVWFDQYSGNLNGNACPAGFTQAPSSLNGYVLIGDPDATGAGVGTTNGLTPLSSGTDPSHTHAFSSSTICTSPGVETIKTGPVINCAQPSTAPSWSRHQTFCNTNAASVPSNTSGFPFVQLVACVAITSPPVSEHYTVEDGATFFMSTSVTTCTSPFSTMDSGLGRTLVPLDPALALPNIPVIGVTTDRGYVNAISSITTSTSLPWELPHTHNVNTTASFNASGYIGDPYDPFDGNIYGDVVPVGANPANIAVRGTSSAVGSGIPLTKVKICTSSTMVSDPGGIQLPQGSMVFYSRSAGCPNTYDWQTVSEYMGRLIVVAPSFAASGLKFGSNDLLATATVSGTGPSHVHSPSIVVVNLNN